MRHFTLQEMCASKYGKRKGLVNIPSEYQRANLIALVVNVLDPLRDIVGVPIRVTSGYRSLAINIGVGGVARSQHRQGEAADIVCARLSVKELYKTVLDHQLPFDQMINEYNRWLHISYRRDHKNRRHHFERK